MKTSLDVLRIELLQLARDKRALFSAIVLPATVASSTCSSTPEPMTPMILRLRENVGSRSDLPMSEVLVQSGSTGGMNSMKCRSSVDRTTRKPSRS